MKLTCWKPWRPPAPPGSRVKAFTMIEIVISLAIIGFALIAIVGILPLGMSAQRENREETIINQDASIFLQAIRNGELGVDDLTNYVVAVTNYWTEFNNQGGVARSGLHWYTQTDSWNPGGGNPMPLTNGARVVGLLSTPRVRAGNNGWWISNYTFAIVRSISGPASEKFPQTNAEVHDLTLTYRLISEVLPYAEFDTNWVWYAEPSLDPQEALARSNYWVLAKNLQTNLWDLRLTFRWPLLANRTAGNGRQVFRAQVSGRLLATNDYWAVQYPLYFFEPRDFVKAP